MRASWVVLAASLGVAGGLAAAGGGFGGGVKRKASKASKAKTTKSSAASRKKRPASPPAARKEDDKTTTLEAAMTLLKSRGAFEERLGGRGGDLVAALGRGVDGRVAVLDDVLGADACAALRREAEGVHAGYLAADAGNADDDVTRTRAELLDPEDFARCPRVVACSLAIATAVSEALGGARGLRLSSDCGANMLSCYASGGAFPVHVDNHGGDDRRVFGAIYYMNPDYRDEAGGHFVPWRRRTDGADAAVLDPRDLEAADAIAPRGDRLIVFEADTLAHSVRAYRDDAYRRYALTVWILAADGVEPSAVLRPERKTLSPTATHAGMADTERADASSPSPSPS